MASEQQQRPITYGDVFSAQGAVGSQPITKEDAALMQSVEASATGQTQKGGAAAAMQSAADRNVSAGMVRPDAHSFTAEEGMRITETGMRMPGEGGMVQTEFVADQPVMAVATAVPTPITGIADAEPMTVGEVLEAAAVGAGNTPVTKGDAQAIQSAESLVAGQNPKAGIGAAAQSMHAYNVQRDPMDKMYTLSDVLTDARSELPADKFVTREDAERVRAAELRGRGGEVKPGGVSDTMQTAADINESFLATRSS